MAGQTDKWGIPFWHPSKAGGFFHEMEDDPKGSKFFDFGSGPFKFDGNGVITMSPDGPTDFGIGKNISGFKDSIGGCDMDFAETAARGYAYKKDDARDIEYKALVKIDGIESNAGFSISVCTGHHGKPEPCCQGFAYMCTIEVTENPSSFRFRKEIWHVQYKESPQGKFTHSKCNFKINGVGRYVGIGVCRYNKKVSGEDDHVVLEVWFNPDPDSNITDWTKLKSIEDRPGFGWGSEGGKCNGEKDQVGTWSNVQNRMKTNSTKGKILFKKVSLREIDPSGTDTGGGGGPSPVPTPGPLPVPPPTTGTVAKDWIIRYNLGVFGPNTCGAGIATPGLNKFYDVADNGSASNLHRDRYRACMVANGSASKFIGRVPRRVVVLLSSTGTLPTGPITVTLRRGSDDEVAVTYTYTGGPALDATALTDTKTEYTFENLTSTYVWSNGDRICVEYSSNTSDTENDVNVWRNTDNPYDGTASCAVKFDAFQTGSTTPDAYTAPDTGRDYAWEIWDGTDIGG